MFIKVEPSGTSLVVSGLSVSTREGEGSIPGHGVEISQATAKKKYKIFCVESYSICPLSCLFHRI